MKPILKIYGLPHSGTNLAYWLLTVNFETYTCGTANFHVDYLGWKHAFPPSQQALEYITTATGEQPLFVFTDRDYESWSEAITHRHQGRWEFDPNYTDKFVFHTPMGIQIYESREEFYNIFTAKCREFQEEHPDISVRVNFSELASNQKEVVQAIGDKFNLKRCYEDIVTINKQVTSDGEWLSRANEFYRE